MTQQRRWNGLLLILPILLSAACSSTGSRSGMEVKITPDMFHGEDGGTRKLDNPLFAVVLKNSRKLEIENHGTGEKKEFELDWPLNSITLCPNCGYASIWYLASNGAPYNALLELKSGEVIQQLGPSEYQWSDKGIFMAMGYPQKVEVIRSDLFESYLEAGSAEDKAKLLHRSLEVNPSTGKEVTLIGFYEDWVVFFNLGCCGTEKVFGLDLEESQVVHIPCSGSECRDLDDLGEIFTSQRGKPKPKGINKMFRLKP